MWLRFSNCHFPIKQLKDFLRIYIIYRGGFLGRFKFANIGLGLQHFLKIFETSRFVGFQGLLFV